MKRTPLHSVHAGMDAKFTETFGWEIPASFSDVSTEYLAARDGVVVIDRSYLGRFKVTGKDALDLLNRLSSNAVDPLPCGTGKATILTTNKGRVIDLLHLFARDSHQLMVTSPQTVKRVAEWIEMYTFLEEVNFEEIMGNTAMIGLLGPQASSLLESLGIRTSELEPYASTDVNVGGITVTLLRSDPLGAVGYDLILPAKAASDFWETLIGAGAVPLGETAFDLLRIESGIPRHGREISEAVNPWEMNFEKFIDFEKGCYIGQEVVLRLNTYKKVQRSLVALSFSTDAEITFGEKLHSIQEDSEKDAGTVTSVAWRTNPHSIKRELIGLGVVKKVYAVAGTKLGIRGQQAVVTVQGFAARRFDAT